MSHEKSETVSVIFPKLGRRWIVVDRSGKNSGVTLGPPSGFNSQREADEYAKRRSQQYDERTGKSRVTGQKQRTSR